MRPRKERTDRTPLGKRAAADSPMLSESPPRLTRASRSTTPRAVDLLPTQLVDGYYLGFTPERISEPNPVCQLTSLHRELHRTGPTSHAHADLSRARWEFASRDEMLVPPRGRLRLERSLVDHGMCSRCGQAVSVAIVIFPLGR